MRIFLLLLTALTAAAQEREIGFLAEVGFPTKAAITGTPASVTAGFAPGVGAGFLIGHDRYPRWSGEIRYEFRSGEARLASKGQNAAFSAQAHALRYDVIWHSRPKRERLRPYLAFGGGAKIYRGTGAEAAYRPLMEYAWLTRSSDTKPLLAVGGGIKVLLGERVLARFDFRDQLTPFPSKVVTPATRQKVRAWLHDFVPCFGLSWLF
jgi:hypothetical protein